MHLATGQYYLCPNSQLRCFEEEMVVIFFFFLQTGHFLNGLHGALISKQTFQKHTVCLFVYDDLMLIGFTVTPGTFIKCAICGALIYLHVLVFLKAVLMKIDAFHYIQLGTVYR